MWLLLLLLAYACGFFAGLNSMCVLHSPACSPLPCLLVVLSPHQEAVEAIQRGGEGGRKRKAPPSAAALDFSRY